MADTDQILSIVLSRLDALEVRNDLLEQENHALRARVEGLDHVGSAVPASIGASLIPSNALVSRRQVLRRAVQATAATVVAGVLVGRDTDDAAASHTGQRIDVDVVSAHTIFVDELRADYVDGFGNGGWGVRGATHNDTDVAGVYGQNTGTGPGVTGWSRGGTGVMGEGVTGVAGTSSTDWYGAVSGAHTGMGYGVVGDATAAETAGVLGRNSLGKGMHGQGATGVYGVGGTGVHGVSAATGNSAVLGEAVGAAIGVRGTSQLGFGGLFQGGRAQLRLVPTGRIGKPTTGAHAIGELYLDKAGTLFICTAAGTSGTWRKVTTALA